MSLRWRFILYVGAVHLAAGAAVAPHLWHQPWRLLAAEVVFVVSLLVGLRLVRRLFGTLSLIRDSAHSLRDGDFTSRLRMTRQSDLDQLIDVYNQMVDRLRNDRVRLQEQHHFLSQILAQSPSGIVVLDFDDGVVLVNPSARRLLGTDAERASVLASLAAGESEVLHLPDGRRVKCQHRRFVDRGFSRSFFLIDELTEELRQAEKAAYEKLIRTMSHEVNNSVGAAGSLLHSCLNYAPLLPEEHRQDLETALHVVINRTDQLGRLMSGFAEVVRLPAPVRQPTDIEALLRQVSMLLRAECERRRVTWLWEIEAAPGLVDLDSLQLEQVFVNVAKNALEAIDHDGTLTVCVGLRDARPFVSFKDTGPGIPAEARAQLFSPFFSTKETGQGIGLMLVREILDQHHFDYVLESLPVCPTTFTIVFR